MSINIFVTFLFISTLIKADIVYATWDEQIKNYADLMDAKTYNIITAQYNSSRTGLIIKIADEQIKNIPIKESGEAIIDVNFINNSRIKMLPIPKKPFQSPEYSSGFNTASNIRLNIYTKLEKMIEICDVIAPRFGFKPGQISIKIFEGLRDLAT
ncbi:MAG: hypothetical protein K0R02_1188 [Rickettsiaceae bacterium]|jgi:hypothetical protein|nr:hypothetical protein [Rickettsiaceae bacterium]